MSMEEKLKEQIKQHLPEMAAKEMAEFIANAEKTKKELEASKGLVERLNIEVANLKVGIANLGVVNQDLINDKNSVQAQRKANEEERDKLEALARNMEVEKLKIRLQESERRNDDIKEITMIAFKNPVVKQSVHDNRIRTSERVVSEYNSRTGNYDNIVVKDEYLEPTTQTTVSEVE